MESKNYRTWTATLDLRICGICFMMHGKIYSLEEKIDPAPPLHPKCRCVIEALKARLAGTATMLYRDGADWWLKYNGMLPDYYITLRDAKELGYRPLFGNLADVLPGMMITK